VTLHATLDLARRVDRAEIEFCALAGATHGSVEALDVAGGRAIFSRPGSPLNKVLGLGLHGAVADADLDRVEAFYAARRVPTQIELCPLAFSDLAARLCARGYLLEAFENELGARVADTRRAAGDAAAGEGGVQVTMVAPEQDALWTRVVADGFVAFEPPAGGSPAAKELSTEQMVEMMSQFEHPRIRRYLAWIGGEPAGGGAAWTYQGVLGIFGTSTLPRFRRRGVQRALTARTLTDAADADVAIATTSPGSTSQRTFERLGFHVLYTRAIFVRD